MGLLASGLIRSLIFKSRPKHYYTMYGPILYDQKCLQKHGAATIGVQLFFKELTMETITLKHELMNGLLMGLRFGLCSASTANRNIHLNPLDLIKILMLDGFGDRPYDKETRNEA